MSAVVSSRDERKSLGQTFTGQKTARLLAALAWRAGMRRVLDPMAGTGDLLAACAEIGRPTEMFGVEIEADTARQGASRLDGVIRRGDAFAVETWRDALTHGLFDLVIANPPYVRYQSLAAGTRTPERIRAMLLRIARDHAPAQEAAIWEKLIRAYSGLADLSVPSWLLCGLLTKPGGTLALVVPQTWMNRDYARVVRYAFQRFFQPLTIVQESGQRWFQDVLVPVSLVIGRRLPANASVIPLRERNGDGVPVMCVEVTSAAASDASHVGAAFPGPGPERQFAQWLAGGGAGEMTGIRVSQRDWSEQRNEILSACGRAAWLGSLEPAAHGVQVAFDLPSGFASLLPTDLVRHTIALADTPLRVGQGLRTGCNPFFYVERDGTRARAGECVVRLSELFDARSIGVPAETLVPVLRRQTEVQGMSLTSASLNGRALDLRGWYLPEDSAARRGRTMPEPLAEYVRLAARTRYARSGDSKLIPELSAVSPNARDSADDELPGLASSLSGRWYMLPNFAPRHRPALFLPRIIHDEPCVGVNSKTPVLVDANFSTFWSDDADWHPHAAFALRNSAWGRLCMEALGSPLGGGALKLEATHLRRLPLPPLSRDDLAELRRLGSEWLHSTTTGAITTRVDRLVFSRLSGETFSLRKSEDITAQLHKAAVQLRSKRRLTNHSEQP
jgi:hypothetical protein